MKFFSEPRQSTIYIWYCSNRTPYVARFMQGYSVSTRKNIVQTFIYDLAAPLTVTLFTYRSCRNCLTRTRCTCWCRCASSRAPPWWWCSRWCRSSRRGWTMPRPGRARPATRTPRTAWPSRSPPHSTPCSVGYGTCLFRSSFNQ